MCPLKGVIGDYKKPDEAETKPSSGQPPKQ